MLPVVEGNGKTQPAVLTDTLCTRCGLCCDGTLLGDVELTGPAEAVRLQILGLDVEADDADAELLALPCAAIQGTRCRIYTHRPQCCRTFECRLLQETLRGEVTVDQALSQVAHARAQVQEVKTLLARMEPRRRRLPLAERCADAIAEAPEASRDVAALEAAMAQVTHTIRTTFL